MGLRPRSADLGGSVASCSASFLEDARLPAEGSGRLPLCRWVPLRWHYPQCSVLAQREGGARRVLSWRTSWPRSECLTKMWSEWLTLQPFERAVFQPSAPITADCFPPWG